MAVLLTISGPFMSPCVPILHNSRPWLTASDAHSEEATVHRVSLDATNCHNIPSKGTDCLLTAVVFMQANGNLDSLYAEHVDGILRISMRKKDAARR